MTQGPYDLTLLVTPPARPARKIARRTIANDQKDERDAKERAEWRKTQRASSRKGALCAAMHAGSKRPISLGTCKPKD